MKRDFDRCLRRTGEYGVVRAVRPPLAFVDGLPGAFLGERLVFESGQEGEVFLLEEGRLAAAVYSSRPPLVGSRVARSGRPTAIRVGERLLGQVADSFGRPFFAADSFSRPRQRRPFYVRPEGMVHRRTIKKPLDTGVTVVDLLVPLGRGQRELVVGDKKTGKTSFLMTAAKAQIKQGAVVIYALVGKKMADIVRLRRFFKEERLAGKAVLIASRATDSPPLIFLTPYAAMSLAEYFRDSGRNVLVIFDDLSTQARAYREMSLVARRFPGRESYPGDVFHAQARLLERAGNFAVEGKERAISCLAAAEAGEGDLAGYITTNLMSITDGHIYFDTDYYHQGRRPAINHRLSVTRVGKQTQSPLRRDTTFRLLKFLNRWEEINRLSHFGAELLPASRAALATGLKLEAIFSQHYREVVPAAVQLGLAAAIWGGWREGRAGTVRPAAGRRLAKAVRRRLEKKAAAAADLPALAAALGKDKSLLEALWQTKN